MLIYSYPVGCLILGLNHHHFYIFVLALKFLSVCKIHLPDEENSTHATRIFS